jgi:small subunit ribosomal protein S16
VAVVIRLQRAGARNRPFYRVVVTDSRKPRDGSFLEKVGYFDPVPDPDVIYIDHEKVESWIAKGAKPTDAAKALIKRAKRGGVTAPKDEPVIEPAAEEAAAGEPAGEVQES